MHLFFSAGEPSGDQHAAQLITELKQRAPGFRASGYGGPEMTAAGLQTHFPLTELAVMGFAGVAPMLKKFWNLYRQAEAFLTRERPDAVVLVDFPGFNWWIARAAKRSGVPVYYYCPPQIWAWAGWRIHKARRLIDCVLSVLPFEAQWYRERGLDVEYVGHPFFDEVAAHPLRAEDCAALRPGTATLVGVLPGSRKQEVQRNFPIMLEMIDRLSQRHPQTHFAVACYRDWHRRRCEELLVESARPLPVSLHINRTSEIIQESDCCLMVSGSVSLEMLARKTPAVVMYRAGLLTYLAARAFGNVDYISLPNLAAGRPIMPEFPFLLRRGDHVDEMTRILDGWLADPSLLAESRRDVSDLADQMVDAGGIARAAEVLVARLDRSEPLSRSRAA